MKFVGGFNAPLCMINHIGNVNGIVRLLIPSTTFPHNVLLLFSNTVFKYSFLWYPTQGLVARRRETWMVTHTSAWLAQRNTIRSLRFILD